jgi:uncharacterized protein
MLNEPLPSQIDVRKLVNKGAEIKAQVPVSSLPRFATMLACDEGQVTAELRFYVDEERKRRIDGKVVAKVQVTCQRCLEPVPKTVESDFSLAVVWTDDEARHLPKHLEPIIVGEELIDLADVVEEELILSFPFVTYHDDENCRGEQPETAEPMPKASQQQANKDNPFKVLEQLKSSK